MRPFWTWRWGSRRMIVILVFVAVSALVFWISVVNQVWTNTPKLRIAVVPKMDHNAYWDALHAGAIQGVKEIEASEKARIELIWRGPFREGDIEGQTRILTELAGEKINALVISPADLNFLVEPVNALANQGVSIITFDSRLNSPEGKIYVGTHNYGAGIRTADHVAKLLKGKGRVLLQRYMAGSASSMEREAGFSNQLREKYPQIEILPWRTYCGPNDNETFKVCSEGLVQFGNQAQVVVATTQHTGNQMIRAMNEAGLVGKIPLVVFDTNPLLVDSLKDGRVYSLVVQAEMEIGRKAVQVAYSRVLGKETPREVFTPVTIVTRENMDVPAIRELINPPIGRYLSRERH